MWVVVDDQQVMREGSSRCSARRTTLRCSARRATAAMLTTCSRRFRPSDADGPSDRGGVALGWSSARKTHINNAFASTTVRQDRRAQPCGSRAVRVPT